ncbi:MAG: acyltransferase, partial [Elusimicrobiota bacterium]
DRWRLGASFSHAVVDGYSAHTFLGSWSGALAGRPIRSPLLDRSALIPPAESLAADPAALDPEGVREACGWSGSGERRPAQDRERDRLRFGEARMRELAADAGAEIGMGLSANDLLCAHLWRTVFAGRPELTIPFDFRRLHPDLGLGFFGNAVVGVPVSLGPGETPAAVPVKELALRIHAAVRERRQPQVLRALRALERLRRAGGNAALQGLAVCHPDRGALITNLSRLNKRGLDFGGGELSDIRFRTEFAGTAVILPGSPDGLEAQVLA